MRVGNSKTTTVAGKTCEQVHRNRLWGEKKPPHKSIALINASMLRPRRWKVGQEDTLGVLSSSLFVFFFFFLGSSRSAGKRSRVQWDEHSRWGATDALPPPRKSLSNLKIPLLDFLGNLGQNKNHILDLRKFEGEAKSIFDIWKERKNKNKNKTVHSHLRCQAPKNAVESMCEQFRKGRTFFARCKNPRQIPGKINSTCDTSHV